MLQLSIVVTQKLTPTFNKIPESFFFVGLYVLKILIHNFSFLITFLSSGKSLCMYEDSRVLGQIMQALYGNLQD